MRLLIYDKYTGQILGDADIDESVVDLFNDSLPDSQETTWWNYVNHETHYFDLVSTFLPRPEMVAEIDKTLIAADGVEMATISNVPEGCKITIAGQEYIADSSGAVSFALGFPSIYTVTLELFPYIDKLFEVTAV